MARSKVRPGFAVATGRPAADTNGDVAQPSELNFSNLSEKIRAQFQSVQEDRKNKKTKEGHKKQTNDDSSSGPKGLTQLNDAPKPSSTRGTKRTHDGEALPKQRNKNAEASENAEEADIDILRQEILALGGTTEDLDLIEGAESASEVEDEGDAPVTNIAEKEKGIQKGLSNKLK